MKRNTVRPQVALFLQLRYFETEQDFYYIKQTPNLSYLELGRGTTEKGFPACPVALFYPIWDCSDNLQVEVFDIVCTYNEILYGVKQWKSR